MSSLVQPPSRDPAEPVPSRTVRGVRWIVYALVGVHVLLAILLLGRQPLLFRVASALLSRDAPETFAMRLALYRTTARSGRGLMRATSDASAALEAPHAALDAYAIWQVPKAGTYTLVFQCDDRGAVFLDGHRVIGLIGTSINHVGRATLELTARPHLLVVYLDRGAGRGWFRLDVQPPGATEPGLLSPHELRPVHLRYFPIGWRWAYAARAWVNGLVFWVMLVAAVIGACAIHRAPTLGVAGRNALLVLGSSAVALVLAEIAVRLVLAPPQRVAFRGSTAQRPTAAARDVFMIPTDRGFRHNPNSEVIIENSPVSPGVPLIYRTNSLGQRNREIGPKTGERILFLGDSITFGLGVNEAHTFVRQVEELAHRDGKAWETVNAGVNGLGTNGELAVLSESGLAVNPDVVVLGFYLNDFLESPGIFLTRLPGLLDRSALAHQLGAVVSQHFFLSQSEREALDSPPMLKPPDEIYVWQEEFARASTIVAPDAASRRAADDLNALVLRFFEDWGGGFSPRVWPKLEGLLAEYARVARQHGIRPMIVAFPVRYQVEPTPLFDYPQQRLRDIARRLQVPYLDMLPRLRAEYAKAGAAGPPLFLDQCHLAARGNEVTAAAIYEFLQRPPAAE